MNKQEAGSLLKEVLAKCNLDSESFVLVEPDLKDTLSMGYKLRIKTVLDNECRQRLREITKKHNLAVIDEQIQITVYKPKSNHTDHLILK